MEAGLLWAAAGRVVLEHSKVLVVYMGYDVRMDLCSSLVDTKATS